MAVEAPYSKHKLGNLKIFAVVLIVLGVWFAYDGYMNQKFIKKHTDENGKASGTLEFNKKSPPFFIGGAVAMAAILFTIKGRKITASDSDITDGKRVVPYNKITKIDKTYLSSKGFFVITYTDNENKELNWKISDKVYDNLSALVDFVASKIS